MERAKKAGKMEVYRAVARRMRDLEGGDDVERDLMAGVRVYEEQVLREKHGRRQPATRTRQAIRNKGAYQAIIDWCDMHGARDGFLQLAEAGLLEFTAEAIAVKYADRFPPDTVAKARAVLTEHSRIAQGTD
jgi:hypothetical protein